jgi:hypothetical protein
MGVKSASILIGDGEGFGSCGVWCGACSPSFYGSLSYRPLDEIAELTFGAGSSVFFPFLFGSHLRYIVMMLFSINNIYYCRVPGMPDGRAGYATTCVNKDRLPADTMVLYQ